MNVIQGRMSQSKRENAIWQSCINLNICAIQSLVKKRDNTVIDF